MAKEPSAAQLAARKKFGDAAKAKAAARRNAVSETSNPENLAVNQPTPPEPTDVPDDQPVPEPHDPGLAGEPSYSELEKQVLELKAAMFDRFLSQPQATPAQTSGPQITERGIVGTKERYPTDPGLYPDPRDRLATEVRLQSVAFPYNYELEYKCNPTRRYQTQDGVWQIEPQFELELNRIILDPMSGAQTNGRYTICRGIFFEDPDSALVVAQEKGLRVDEFGEHDFLNEMRYLRMRDWLFDAFFTPMDTSPKSNKREIVIDGKLVPYFEVSGEDAQNIPFDKLTQADKLKV